MLAVNQRQRAMKAVQRRTRRFAGAVYVLVTTLLD
jgi:hypothetical protein